MSLLPRYCYFINESLWRRAFMKCPHDGGHCHHGCSDSEKCYRKAHGMALSSYRPSFKDIGQEIGQLVDSKQKQYGDSAGKSGGIMRILYPEGIAPHQMDDALLTVRILDKLSRIAQRGEDGKDLGGESPFGDIAGYGLLGLMKDRNNQ